MARSKVVAAVSDGAPVRAKKAIGGLILSKRVEDDDDDAASVAMLCIKLDRLALENEAVRRQVTERDDVIRKLSKKAMHLEAAVCSVFHELHEFNSAHASRVSLELVDPYKGQENKYGLS